MAADRPFVVFKVGGSLFDLPDLAARLRTVWAMWPVHSSLTVVGGGAAADVVRDWDRVFQLGEETAHWLAIDALDLSAKLVEQLVPELRLVRSLGQMRAAHAEERPALLCVKCFVKWLETQPSPLPHCWDVTTDSIAAAVSGAWFAEELVLLKSRELPESGSLPSVENLIAEDMVDGYFGQAITGIEKITWINLRADSLEKQTVRRSRSTSDRIN